jgi:predicted O-methyltransferase YrrM
MRVDEFKEIDEIYESSKDFFMDEHIKSISNSASVDISALKFIGKLVEKYQPRNICEFGGGVSTLFLASLKTKQPLNIYSLEHSAFFLKKTEKLFKNNKFVKLIYSPIKFYKFKYKFFAAYDKNFVSNLQKNIKFDLVFIDGPPGLLFGREACLYLIAPFITENTLILLDDSNRKEEKRDILAWQKVWGNNLKIKNIVELSDGISIIKIKNINKTKFFPFTIKESFNSFIRMIKLLRSEKFRKETEKDYY